MSMMKRIYEEAVEELMAEGMTFEEAEGDPARKRAQEIVDRRTAKMAKVNENLRDR